LLDYCEQEDADSAQLLASYMEQRFPGDDYGDEREHRNTEASGAGVSRTEALAVIF